MIETADVCSVYRIQKTRVVLHTHFQLHFKSCGFFVNTEIITRTLPPDSINENAQDCGVFHPYMTHTFLGCIKCMICVLLQSMIP